MDQESANKEISKLGVLVLLESPPQIQLGIDNIQWVIGSKFKGIKLIPLGTHYVHYCTKDENYQFKLGFFCRFTPDKRIIVKRWDKDFQDYIMLDEDEAKSYEHAVQINDLDCYLGPYPWEGYQAFKSVANYIDDKVLERLDPIQKKLVYLINQEYEEPVDNENIMCSEGEDSDDSEIDESKHKKDNEQKQQDFNILAGTIYYSDIPQSVGGHKLQGAALTQANHDKSIILEKLISRTGSYKVNIKYDYQSLFGELQYSFIKFLLGEHYESFEQWKKLLIIITQCETLALKMPEFYIDFIPVLYDQITQLPKDFFIDPLSNNNFIKYCLKNLFEICESEQLPKVSIIFKQLNSRIQKLKQMINDKFIIDQSADDDDGPLIVDSSDFVQI